jgi:hypothetical protein
MVRPCSAVKLIELVPERLYPAGFIGAVDPIHGSPIGVREPGSIDNV